jgi:CRP/FNR family cyclic AMP-dependent transcriptional regulator
MNIQERREFLARVSIFSRCKRGDLKALAKSCQEMTFEEGEVICKQGERGSALFIITSGKAEVMEEQSDGNVVKLAEIYEPGVIGELSVIDGESRTATVVARQRTQCLVLTSWDLNATIKDRPLIALDILKIVIERYRSLTEKFRGLSVLH